MNLRIIRQHSKLNERKQEAVMALLRDRSWTEDGSAVKNTDLSSRGPEFNCQESHGGSQPSLKGSNALFWCV